MRRRALTTALIATGAIAIGAAPAMATDHTTAPGAGGGNTGQVEAYIAQTYTGTGNAAKKSSLSVTQVQQTVKTYAGK